MEISLSVGFSWWLSKKPTCNAQDTRYASSIPDLERSLVGEHGNPLQYACLDNPMDGEAWWAKTQTRLK